MKMNKKFLKISSAILILAIIAMIMPFQETQAAALLNMSDTMSRLKAVTASSHTIKFTTPTGAGDSTDTIIVTFPDTGTTPFDFTGKAIGTVTFTHGASTGEESEETLAAVPSETDWGAVFSGTKDNILTLTAPTDGEGTAAVAASDKIILTYDSTDSTNPSADASPYAIAISGTFGDSGSITVDIIADDQVAVTATVNPTMSFAISSNTCALGTLTTSTVEDCQYTLAVGTNAVNGAVITIQGITDGTNANLNKDGTPASFINDIANDGTVTAGTEGYGVTLVGGAGWTEAGDFVDDATPIPSAVTDILTIATPIASSVTSTVTHQAAIGDITEAGTYSQTVQYIATGTF